MDLKTNIDYTINIPEEDRSWISVATGTKAFVTETKSFIVLQNTTGAPRSSTISFVPEDGETVYYTISQKYDVTNPEFSVSPVSISAAMTDESASFNVSGNTPWYIDLTGDCTASTLSGVGAATVTLTFGANNNVGYRNFTATVHSTATTVSPNVYTVAVEQEGLPDPNDYYSVFKRGEDITINGKAYNIKDYPNPRLVKPAELTDGEELVKSVSANGILFIDDDANSRITIAGRDSILLPDVVVIGRYRNSQPTIDAGSLNLCPVGGVVVFKNIGYTSANPYGFMFNNDREEVTGNSSIILEDCSIITATNTPVIRDQNTKYSYERIVVNNSVVVCPQPILLDYSVTKTDNATALSEFKVTNSTLNLPNGALYNYYRMLYLDRNNIDLPNVVVTLDHNTIYGMNYGFLPLKGVKSININHNVIAAPLPRNIYILSLTENVRETSSFNNNVFASTTTFQYYPCNGATAGRGVTNTPNTVLKETNVFTKTDFANGYLPVDTSVVTDGSGCDYSTKLWKNWN